MSQLRAPLAAAAGVIVGVTAVVIVQGRVVRAAGTTGAPPAGGPGPVALQAREGPPSVDLATQRRLTELEMRVRDLSQPKKRDDAPAASDDPVEERKPSVERARQQFEDRLAEHALSPRDGRWATGEERAITKAVGDLARPGTSFSLVGVDCRTTTCVARLKWPSEGAARAEMRDLVQNADVNCARQMILPAPGTRAEYEASVLFDCAPSD